MVTQLSEPTQSGVIDPELERIMQDLKRVDGAVRALQERLMRYLAARAER